MSARIPGAVLTVALAAAVSTVPARADAPRIRWEVNEGGANCSVLRTAAGAAGPSIILRHDALGFGGDVLVASSVVDGHVADGTTIRIVVDGEPVSPRLPIRVVWQAHEGDGPRFLQTSPLTLDDMRQIQRGRVVELHAGNRRLAALDVAAPESVSRAVAACSRAALTAAGVGSDVVDTSARYDPPFLSSRTSPGSWLSHRDTPRGALRDRAQGRVGVLLLVGPDRQAVRCIVGRSSGRQDLDAAACRAVTERADYRPADARAYLTRYTYVFALP